MSSSIKGINETVVTNKKARHEFHIETTYVAGLVLRGTEVKSLREGKVSIQEAFAYIQGGEIFLSGMSILPYKDGTYNNHDPLRVRKVLLTSNEIKKIVKAIDKQGMTLVPLKIFFNERNLAKLEIGVAKGKKLFDKRETSKERDVAIELKRKFG